MKMKKVLVVRAIKHAFLLLLQNRTLQTLSCVIVIIRWEVDILLLRIPTHLIGKFSVDI
jgi:hypothetical protein